MSKDQMKEKVEMEEKRKKKLAISITEDFERRRDKRRALESGWLLNLNFFSGNQYCDVSPFGGIEEENELYYWQSKRVFNHIAPAIDSRLSKLATL